jgi:peptidoglycan hydrolase-like protein with peptidoglycan-binding domain
MATTEESPVLRAVWRRINGKVASSSGKVAKVELGGIAPSSTTAYGYHNARDRHLKGKTERGKSDYSVRLADDLAGSTGRFYCGLDLSGKEPTRIITKRLRDAAAKRDPRIRCLREFYGSLDNKAVFGRIHNSPSGGWMPSTSDDSHLWHVHLSLFRRFAADESVVAGLAAVILGTGTAQRPGPSANLHEVPLGTRVLRRQASLMKGSDVRYVQRFIGEAKCGAADGFFGPNTESGVRWYQDMRGIAVNGTVDKGTWSNLGVRTHGL